MLEPCSLVFVFSKATNVCSKKRFSIVKLKANVLQVGLPTPLDKIFNQVPVLILPLNNKWSNCEIKKILTLEIPQWWWSQKPSWSPEGHTEYREISLWDCSLVHYLSHPLKLIIMILLFYFLFFAPVDLFNSLCLIPSIVLSGFKRHTCT